MNQNKECTNYDYIGCHTNDFLIMAMDAQDIIDSLMKIYEISKLVLFTSLDMIT